MDALQIISDIAVPGTMPKNHELKFICLLINNLWLKMIGNQGLHIIAFWHLDLLRDIANGLRRLIPLSTESDWWIKLEMVNYYRRSY